MGTPSSATQISEESKASIQRGLIVFGIGFCTLIAYLKGMEFSSIAIYLSAIAMIICFYRIRSWKMRIAFVAFVILSNFALLYFTVYIGLSSVGKAMRDMGNSWDLRELQRAGIQSSDQAALLDAYYSGDSEKRIVATQFLTRKKYRSEPVVQEALLAALSDNSDELKGPVLSSLADAPIFHPKVVPALLKIIEASSGLQKLKAIQAIGFYGDSAHAALPLLQANFSNADEWIKVCSAASFSQINTLGDNSQAFQILSEALLKPNPEESFAINSLKYLVLDRIKSLGSRARELRATLTNIRSQDSSALMRIEAGKALEAMSK